MLKNCVTSYLADCYALAEGTKGLYRDHLERFALTVGDVDMGAVTPAVMRGFLGGLRRVDGGRYSAAYVDQVYRTLNTFLRWCVAEGRIEVNPLSRVRRPRVPKKKSPRLTLPEVLRVLAVVRTTAHPGRNLAMVCLAVDSGLRRSEVLKLEVGNVDLGRGVVMVTGKGAKDREVPIGRATAEALAAYLAVRPVCGCARVFVTAKGKGLSVAGVQTMMYRLKERAGLPQLRWHLLRHTFSNLFIDAGGGLRQLQAILGHSDIRTTASIYTDPDLALLQRSHRLASPFSSLRLNGEEVG